MYLLMQNQRNENLLSLATCFGINPKERNKIIKLIYSTHVPVKYLYSLCPQNIQIFKCCFSLAFYLLTAVTQLVSFALQPFFHCSFSFFKIQPSIMRFSFTTPRANILISLSGLISHMLGK